MSLPVNHIFIHHTAGPRCLIKSRCSKIVRDIQKYHMSLDWDDIGYNFLIGGDGNVYVGRSWDKIGAHTLGANNISIAFSLLGDYMDFLPSIKMLRVTQLLIACAVEKKVVPKRYLLHGHRDQTCTLCPGDAFYNYLRRWPHYLPGPLSTYVCKS
ncbi:hypothetical protein RDWZM_007462 [Blomia tropicalis]|uniref:Peptidoglycan-recognition protein n=1 Tax=Blomia tropicalis TaxID=40697 RepID=A0A9Q0M2I9_BLOTA|nr:hypothetical protein RDWZM_007462 [Blomia tropicalis]